MTTTTATPNTENEIIKIDNYFIELLLKRLNEELQNAVELMPQDCNDLYSTAYFKGCQAAYKSAIEDVHFYLIEAQEAANEKTKYKPLK